MDSEEQEPLINELPGVEPEETDPCSVSANVERQGAYHGVAPAASETFSESRVQEPANVMPEGINPNVKYETDNHPQR